MEQRAEDSRNAALAGRELPPADVIAAGQRITWRARQLRAAGLDGDLDQLRGRALIDLLLGRDPLTAENCDHRFEAKGHDPGVKLRHLTQVRYATCTSPICRRPAATSDFEHNTPYEAGGRTCLCNTGPKCRHDHRVKQHPQWKVEQRPDGTFTWTTPSGRTYTTEPTRYPI